MSFYSLLKFVHVLLAITAVGSNITYAAWNARGAMEPNTSPSPSGGSSSSITGWRTPPTDSSW
jgi:hypothetical protein